MDIGFVGAGLMGRGMVENLLRHGHKVSVIAHRNRAPINALVEKGATEASSPAVLAAGKQALFLCVTDTEAAAAVLDASLDGALDQRALASFGQQTAALGRDLIRMTELLLWGLRRRWLAERTVRHLRRHPDLFSQVLAVNTGMAPLTSIGLGGLRRLAVGW